MTALCHTTAVSSVDRAPRGATQRNRSVGNSCVAPRVALCGGENYQNRWFSSPSLHFVNKQDGVGSDDSSYFIDFEALV